MGACDFVILNLGGSAKGSKEIISTPSATNVASAIMTQSSVGRPGPRLVVVLDQLSFSLSSVNSRPAWYFISSLQDFHQPLDISDW
jgi:hypothetical protein